MLSLSKALFLLNISLLAAAQSSNGGGDPDGGGDPGTAPELTNWVGNANTAPIQPAHDPFYAIKISNLTAYPDGAIVSQRNISVDGSYQGIDSAVQVIYRTEDSHGKATYTLATILIPHTYATDGRFVVFQAPEEANSINCSPSYQLFGKSGIAEVQNLLTRGIAVVVPDYEGQRGSFTVGQLSGRQVLDAARAALRLPGFIPANQTASIGLWGYGTAAHTTGWAAELADSYAPELPIKGVAVGGYITNLLSWVRSANSSPLSGNVVSSLLGMASEYKDASDVIAEEVIPRRRSSLEAAGTRCVGLNLARFFEQNITSQFFSPAIDPFSDKRLVNVYDLNSLGKRAPKVSMFVYQGSNDNIANTGDVRATVKMYCAGGTPVRYREYSGEGHSAARARYEDVLEYFEDALDGTPPVSSCSRIRNGNFY